MCHTPGASAASDGNPRTERLCDQRIRQPCSPPFRVTDWTLPLAEFHRVLARDGVVVFSTHHPAMDWQLHSPDDYFAIKQVTETWHKGGRPFSVTFWRRPLTAITAAISDAGFIIERIVEPPPLPELQQRDPQDYNKLRTRPGFLFFRLAKRGEAGR